MNEGQKDPGAAAGSAGGYSELTLSTDSKVATAVKEVQEDGEGKEEKQQDKEQYELKQVKEQDKEQDKQQEEDCGPTETAAAEVDKQQQVSISVNGLGQHQMVTESADFQGLPHPGFAAVAETGEAQRAGAESLAPPGAPRAEAAPADERPIQTTGAEDESKSELSTLDLAVQLLGTHQEFPGDAAPFPGQAGDVVLCKSCMKPEGAYTSALCDRCNTSYHMACVDLDEVEVRRLDEWLCPSCTGDAISWTWKLGRVKAGVAQTVFQNRDSPGKRFSGKRKGSSSRISALGTPQQGNGKEGVQQKRSRSVATPEADNVSLRPARDKTATESEHRSSRMELRSHKQKSRIVVEPDSGAGEEDAVEYTQEDYDKRCEVAMKRLQLYVAERNGVLEEGWKARCTRLRQQKYMQVHYLSPSGQSLSSRVQVARYLGLFENGKQRPGADSTGAADGVEELQAYVAKSGGVLGDGWTAQIVPKKHDRGRMRICYHSPTVNGQSQMFKTKAKVAEYLGLLGLAGETVRHCHTSESQAPVELCETESSVSRDPRVGPVPCSTPRQVEIRPSPSQEHRPVVEPEARADQECSETRPCGWEYLS